jgi:hypothetical protein
VIRHDFAFLTAQAVSNGLRYSASATDIPATERQVVHGRLVPAFMSGDGTSPQGNNLNSMLARSWHFDDRVLG